jgi:diguanylate cyclase (GGDEF)-like protein
MGRELLKKMSMIRQLYCLCAIFILPILLLSALLTVQARNDIAFSEKEREGVVYLRAVFPIIANTAWNGNAGDTRTLTSANHAFDVKMSSWEKSTQLRIKLAARKERLAIVETGVELITAIGDGSNLILDPDLDSYYVMDVVVARLPALLHMHTRLDEMLLRNTDSISAVSRSEIGVLRGQIAEKRKGLDESMYAAVRNNLDGSISAKMLKDYSALVASLDRHGELTEQLLQTPEGTAFDANLTAPLRKNHRTVIAQLQKSYDGYLNVLDHLLAARISDDYRLLALSLFSAILATVSAIFLALKISQRIAGNVASLSRRIHDLAKGDFASPIPHQDQNDEIGQIARSLTSFRATAEEKAALQSTLDEERSAAARTLENLAYTDDLTGLPNRKFLNVAIERHIAVAPAAVPSALIYLDLDGFKEVNDTLTHVGGDELLKEVARRLSAFVRDQDVVARLGGDEFAVFVANANDRDALNELSHRILRALVEPFRVQDTLQFLSASAGISILPLTNTHDAFEMVRRSDVAMYRAKALGKNQSIIFDPIFDSEALRRKEIEAALREALKNDEIELWFQPQFQVQTSRLVGVEGLARWTSPRYGVIEPSVFIPIAENSGLINELGRQVMKKAILAVRRWPQLRVSINLSVVQLRHHQFMNDITALVGDLGVPVNRIELEITESVLMDDNPMLTSRMQALRDLGFELALDDFGTGYSSLGYLSRFQFDRLKIDSSFIKGALGSQRGTALLHSIASMGRALGMDVCAEGVETFEGVQSATEAGCTMVQGFYFSPAVNVEGIDSMVATGIADMAVQKAVSADQFETASVLARASAS